MTDLERAVQDLLDDEAREAPAPHEPRRALARTKRRQIATIVGGGITTAALVAGSVVGVGVLLRGDGSTPAIETPFEPPTTASIPAVAGEHEGREWLLSVSPDGACVALTDAFGSDTACDAPPGAGGLLALGVHGTGEAGPPVVFVFGLAAPETAEVSVTDPAEFGIGLDLYDVPGDDALGHLFVGAIPGYPYPYFPDRDGIAAFDAESMFLGGSALPRPEWATSTTTTLAVVASGTWLGEEWDISIWRDEISGDLCYGETTAHGGGYGCDPTRSMLFSRFGELAVRGVGSGSEDGGTTFAWGQISDSVEAVRIELTDGRTIEPEIHPAPAEFPEFLRSFVFTFTGYVDAHVVALDTEGNVLARELVEGPQRD